MRSSLSLWKDMIEVYESDLKGEVDLSSKDILSTYDEGFTEGLAVAYSMLQSRFYELEAMLDNCNER